MQNTSFRQWFTKQTIVAALFGIFIIYFSATAIVDSRLREYEQLIRVQIADQQSALVAIAEVTARNGADAITEAIVRDCPVSERTEFDELLGRLNNGLSTQELTSLERLFGRCGTFYSERKSIMVSRLSREIEIYKTYVEQLSAIKDSDLATAFAVPSWEALAKEEQKQGDLFGRLVSVQDQIIVTLLAGNRADSDEIQEILQEAKEIQETLVVANKQASTIRSLLVPL
jgi:hypothetical protein